MKRLCSQYGQLMLGIVLAVCAVPSYAQGVTLNMLIQEGAIEGLGELEVSCSGETSIDLGNEIGLVFNTTANDCVFLEEGAIDFTNLPEANLDLLINLDGSEFPMTIVNGEGLEDGTTYNVVMTGFSSDDTAAAPTNNPPPPLPEGDIEENACEWARDNDPGAGVFVPGDDCPGLGLVIYDGSIGLDTEVPGCVGQPDVLPLTCRGFTSVIGHTIYAQRLNWVDLGAAKELVGFVQATTINTMIGDSVSAFKNVIIAVSEIPGQFNTSLNCKDVTASENSEVRVVQSGSDVAQENPGKYCELTPGMTYYVNARFDGGESENCGTDATCQYTLVENVPDPN